MDICGHVFICMFISLTSVSPAPPRDLFQVRDCFVHCSSPRTQHSTWHTGASRKMSNVIERTNERMDERAKAHAHFPFLHQSERKIPLTEAPARYRLGCLSRALD